MRCTVQSRCSPVRVPPFAARARKKGPAMGTLCANWRAHASTRRARSDDRRPSGPSGQLRARQNINNTALSARHPQLPGPTEQHHSTLALDRRALSTLSRTLGSTHPCGCSCSHSALGASRLAPPGALLSFLTPCRRHSALLQPPAARRRAHTRARQARRGLRRHRRPRRPRRGLYVRRARARGRRTQSTSAKYL